MATKQRVEVVKVEEEVTAVVVVLVVLERVADVVDVPVVDDAVVVDVSVDDDVRDVCVDVDPVVVDDAVVDVVVSHRSHSTGHNTCTERSVVHAPTKDTHPEGSASPLHRREVSVVTVVRDSVEDVVAVVDFVVAVLCVCVLAVVLLTVTVVCDTVVGVTVLMVEVLVVVASHGTPHSWGQIPWTSGLVQRLATPHRG